MSCDRIKTGDCGQRCEVRGKGMHAPDKEFVFGWTNSPETASRMCLSIELHPTWHSPHIVDRRPQS